MFKFMKSKKGFTLVELMIVVVIMAILVVVAVPIYNSVTDNARAKTCLDNQRTLISNLNTIIMDKGISGVATKEIQFTTKYVNEKPALTDLDQAEINTFLGVAQDPALVVADITSSFQTIPVCGAQEGVLTVTITGVSGGMPTITTSCSQFTTGNNAKHQLTAAQ